MIIGTALYKYARWKKISISIALLTTVLTLSVISFLALSPAKAAPGDTDSFITTWKTDNPGSSNNSSIKIGTAGFGYSYNVDWDNDGTFDEFGLTGAVTHDFLTPGTYTIRIQGSFPRIVADNGDPLKLIDINQWGTGQWVSMDSAFANAQNVTSSATDRPDLSQVANLSGMFNNAKAFNSNIESWDVSNVTQLTSMFSGATSFNQPLANWDISSVTDMRYMFYEATSFNQNLSAWDTSSVTAMNVMFAGASSFNGDISTWNTSGATSLTYMFENATAFNQPLSSWNISNVLYADGMFHNATSFNQDISSWDTSSLNSTNGMFNNAASFKYPLNTFDMTKVTDAANMLYNSGLSSTSVDTTLEAWSGQSLMQNVNLGAFNYCGADDAIAILTTTYSWLLQQTKTCQSLFNGGQQAVIQDNTPSGASLGVMTVSNFTLRALSPYVVACTQPGVDDALFSMDGDTLKSSINFSFTQPLDQNSDNVYELCIRAVSDSGSVLDKNVTVRVVGGKVISDAVFGESNGIKTLKITGSSLLSDPNDYALALDHSLVRLNGQDLRFCVNGFGMTAQQMIDAYSSTFPNIAQTVTDDPPCYFLINNGAIALTETEATIWLPDAFDTAARGTVSVNGSPVYTFNPGAGGDVTPTVDVNGNKDIDNNPVIPALPTFTGVAEPGATVTVTVHSDPVTCTTTADQDGRWSCTLSTALPASVHTVFVQITNPDSSVVELGPYSVVVAGAGGGVVNNNTPLAPNTGFLAKHAAVVKEMQYKKTFALSVFIVGGAVVALLLGAGGNFAYRRLKK